MGKIFDALEKSNKEKVPFDFSPDDAESSKKEQPVLKDVFKKDYSSDKASGQIDKNLVTLLKPQSFEAERFKILKTSLLFSTTGESPKVIMVSSAVPGEGKSFVTANLAISIAQNIDEHVLLIDCDLRLPSIHKRFGYGQTAGLSEYLSGKISLTSTFLKTKVEKLTIIPGGNPPPNPSELLSSDQMAQLIEEVKTRYRDRYIIIDTAPPQLTSEAGALAKLVDGILLVINCGKTKREIVSELVNTFEKDKILGIVFNRYDFQSSAYYGYGKYNKYSKYYGK